MTTVARCERCGTTLVDVLVPGMCPACLMAMAGSQAAPPSQDASGWEACASFDQPIPLFPHLAEPKEPARIGPYHIIERIGEGGMGTVYKAEQREPLRRTVAIKVIKPGMDTADVIARFEGERQALALMNHTNLAKVLDAGATNDGRPYFAMEYVRGEAITNYCDHNKLPTHRRLELFIQACEGVHHAHQKAIIHRDIKPSNILVTTNEASPLVKVIDFGVAKALSHRLTDYSMVTEHGKMIGTPEYMSPEQAEMGGLDVDTRADIYSLGVVLYELLTGTLPFDGKTLRRATFEEFRRIIREDEPPRPSTRITSMGDEKAAEAAARRGTDLRSLSHELRRELEWIPLKAMRKDRTERYRSVSELIDDVRNYLEGRPLIAGPQSTAYYLRKFVRKHAQTVAASAAVFAVILVLLVALGFAAHKANLAVAARDVLVGQLSEENQKTLRADAAAREELSRKLTVFGDTLIKSNQIPAARQSYFEALNIARKLHVPDTSLLASLFATRASGAPVMGDYMTEAGPGGFIGAGHVTSLAISHDGRFVATGDEDHHLILWDLQTGAELHRYTFTTRGVTYVAFSHDDRRLLASSYDGTVGLFEPHTWAEVGSFTAHQRPEPHNTASEVYMVACSPVDDTALSGDKGGQVLLWDMNTRRVIRSLHRPGSDTAHDDAAAALAFSPDGKTAASSGEDKVIRLWDVSTGKLLRELEGHLAQVNSVAFSNDGRLLASSSYDKTVRLWDLSQDRWGGLLLGVHQDASQRVAFSPDGRTVLSGGNDGTVRLWDVAAARRLHMTADAIPNSYDDAMDHLRPALVRDFAGQLGQATGVAFSPDGRLVASSGQGSLARVWSVADDSVFAPTLNPITCVAVSNEGVALFGTQAGELLVRDSATHQPIRTIAAHTGAARCVAIFPDARLAVSAGADGSVKLWDLLSGTEVHKLDTDATGLVLLPGGGALLAESDGTLARWDLSTSPRVISHSTGKRPIESICTSEDASLALTVCKDGSAQLHDLSTGSTTSIDLPDKPWVRTAALARDGHEALLGLADGRILLFDVSTAQVSGELRGHQGAVTGLRFMPAGNTAWSAGSDGSLRFWNVAARLQVASRDASCGPLDALSLSADGRQLVLAGRRGIQRSWDLSSVETEWDLATRLGLARTAPARLLRSPASLLAFGEWFALRGQDAWAIDYLERARQAGAQVPPLTLARLYWRLGRSEQARREYHQARQAPSATMAYIDLCLSGIRAGSAVSHR